jgi:hypothetical protein
VYFKTAADDPIAAPGWSTWVKQAPPSPPDGHFTVSGLSVQLRHGTGTVLVLSPALDPMPPFNFSFVPPLSAPGRPNRAVPRCQHLGTCATPAKHPREGAHAARRRGVPAFA